MHVVLTQHTRTCLAVHRWTRASKGRPMVQFRKTLLSNVGTSRALPTSGPAELAGA